MTTLSDDNMGTIMGKTSLSAPGTKCVIAAPKCNCEHGLCEICEIVIGTEYFFNVTTDVAGGLGMITSVGEGPSGEGTPSTTWAQDGTSGSVTYKTVTFTPTRGGQISLHALCGNAASPLYIIRKIWTIVAKPTCNDIDGSGADFASCVSGTNHLKDVLTNTCATGTCAASDCCEANQAPAPSGKGGKGDKMGNTPAPGPAQKDDKKKKKKMSGAVSSAVISTLVVGVAAVFGSTLL